MWKSLKRWWDGLSFELYDDVSSFEAYITRKNPQTVAEFEHWSKVYDYEKRVSSKNISHGGMRV